MMTLFIDKIVAHTPKGLCLLIGIACVVLSIISMPYTPQMKCIEGIISKYEEDVRHVHHVKGADHDIEFYYIIIEDIRVDIALHEEEKFKGKERYWKEKLEGKHAKVCYLQKYRQIIHDIELEDGSYSYHNPRDISSYGVGWFPFCIFAPIALFCIFVLLRYFYLQTFASDERRILVFGNKDGNLH